MTIHLELNPDLEAKLKYQAAQEGSDEQSLALKLLLNELNRIQDQNEDTHKGWPKGFFNTTYGCLQHNTLERLPQGNISHS